jgi:isopenicillin-N epimerase
MKTVRATHAADYAAPVRELFLLDEDVVFLNHGSFGACPRPVFEAYQRLQLELERNPVQVLSRYRRFPSLVDDVRARLGAYVGTDASNLLLVTNATAGVNAVARSLDLGAGDEIVTTNHEYGGNELLWQWLCERTGARLVVVETLPWTALDDVTGAFGERTRLLFVSHISSPTALRFPVEQLCARAREAGVLTLIDGAHAPGQIDLHLDPLGADFYTGNCHKWLCAPKGAGFLYARPEVQDLVEPLVVSWDWDTPNWSDRQRWRGTADPSPYLAVPAAIDFQEEHAWHDVRARCHELAARAQRELAELLGSEPLGDEFEQMVTVRLPPCDAHAVGERLFEEHRIEALAQDWHGQPVLRVSFQGYNDDSDLDALLEALPSVLR